MNKRVSTLLLSCALCGTMIAPAFAATLTNDDGKLTLSGDATTYTNDDRVAIVRKDRDDPSDDSASFVASVPVTVVDGKFDMEINPNGKDTATYKYGVMIDGVPVWETPADTGSNGGDSNEGGNSGNKKPVIDDGKDDDDSSSTVIKTSGSGGASGASSKYIKNEPRGNQTVTPVTTPSTEWTSETNIPQFTDVASTDWFYNAVQFVGQHGMMAGSNGRFSPYDKLTRGMMAQILYNMEGAPGGTAASFPDVSSSDWFANAATWAASCGYMSGYSNGYFGPLDPITREQLASILYRYASAKGYDVTASSELNFTDGATTSSWAVPAMKWAVGTGLLSGKTGVSGTRLDPLGNATRAEVAQILMNFSQKIAQ